MDSAQSNRMERIGSCQQRERASECWACTCGYSGHIGGFEWGGDTAPPSLWQGERDACDSVPNVIRTPTRSVACPAQQAVQLQQRDIRRTWEAASAL